MAANSGFMSFAFWIALFFAAGLYALVALSPRIYTHALLTQQVQTLQLELLELQDQDAEVEKMIAALNHDPQYARELAMMDLQPIQPGEERIPVSEDLVIQPATELRTESHAPPDLPWYTVIFSTIARSQQIGNTLLMISAAVVVYAFALLHDRGVLPRTAATG